MTSQLYTIFNKLKQLYNTQTQKIYAYQMLHQANRKTLSTIFSKLADHKLHNELNDLIKDIITYKLYKPTPTTFKKRQQLLFIKYHNKSLNYVNIGGKIIRNNTKYWPLDNTKYKINYEKPSIAYAYDNPIKSIICNYRQSLQEHTDKSSYECICHLYQPYVDKFHKHVITANHNICDDNELTTLLNKGPKYRLAKSYDISKSVDEIRKGINKYIKDICSKLKLNINTFTEWKTNIFNTFESFAGSYNTN